MTRVLLDKLGLMSDTCSELSQNITSRPKISDTATPPRSRDIWAWASLFAAALACYANSFGNPFLWDQEAAIVNNPLIRSLRNIPQAFRSDLFGKPLTATGYYRPVGVVTYMLDYRVWGLKPAGFHLTSILLHATAGVLLFYLFRKLGVPGWVNFLVCLFFVIHPANTETVTYLFREESLGLIFSAACFLAYLKVREGNAGFAAAAVVFFVLALLSKETSVVLPFLLAIESALWGRSKMASERYLRASRYLIVALVGVSVAYIGIRQHLISSSGLHFVSTISSASRWQRILTLPRILATYVGLVVFPRHLHMEYLFVTEKASDPAFWLCLLGTCAGGGALIWHLRGLPASEQTYRRQMIFFVSWFLLGLAPFTHVIVPLQATLREHWAYFAGVGLLGATLLLGYFLYRHYPDSRVRAGLLVLLVTLLGYDAVTTVVRNRDWSDPLRLYQHDLQFEPRSFLLHTNLGLIYFRQGRLEDAKREYLKAIEVSPGKSYEVAYSNLGILFEQQGRDDLAETAFRKSITLADYEPAYVNLAFLYLRTHHIAEATAVAEDGVNLYPQNTELHYYLGVAYLAQNRYPEAKRELVATERLQPGYKKVRELLQLIAARNGP